MPLYGTPAPALPPHVVEAVAAALGAASPAPHPRGLPGLRARLASVVAATGRRVDPERELVVTNGAMHALGLCFRSLLDPGDEVVVPAPCFFFEGPIRSAGGVPVYVPGSPEDGWAWDAEALARAVGPTDAGAAALQPGQPDRTGARRPTRSRPPSRSQAATASWSSPTRPTRRHSGASTSRRRSRAPSAWW